MKTLGSSPALSTVICIAESKAALCSHTLFFHCCWWGCLRTTLSC